MSPLDVPPLPASELDVELADAEVDAFRENGFTWVERITTDAELDWLRGVYDALYAERRGGFEGGYFDLARPYDSEGDDLLPQILMPERRVPELRQTLCLRNGRKLAARLLGVAPEALESWGHMILKPAHYGHELPWHQDEAYWEARFEYRALGLWIPLDAATVSNGCMHFVPGSHRSSLRTHQHLHGDASVHALYTEQVDASSAVPVPVPAGGASFHHCRTLHYSGPNRTAHARRAWANEFQTPPVPLADPAPRPWLEQTNRAWAERAPHGGR